MVKLFITLILILSCAKIFAVCSNGEISIELKISESTQGKAMIAHGTSIHLTKDDAVIVTEYRGGYPHTKIALSHGSYTEDGAGNMQLKVYGGYYSRPIYLNFDWDHENSPDSGLDGLYLGVPRYEHQGQKAIDLSSLYCSCEDLGRC